MKALETLIISNLRKLAKRREDQGYKKMSKSWRQSSVPSKHRPHATSVACGLHPLHEEIPWTMKEMDATFPVFIPHLIWTTTFILEAHSLFLSYTIVCIEPGEFTFC